MSIELDTLITFHSVEYAYRRSRREQERNNMAFAELGLRCARQRDPQLLLVLEKATNILIKEDDNQRGETRNNAENHSERRYTTEVQMWREAYKMVDQGTPVPHLQWIYGAAAFLCGYQI